MLNLEELYESAKKWHLTNGKTKGCVLVLELMDSDEFANNYCGALKCVLAQYPEISRAELEKELEKYI